MQKILSFTLCLMLFLAVLVNVGWVNEGGFYGVANDVYDVVVPVTKIVSNSITSVLKIDTSPMNFGRNDSVVLLRGIFKGNSGDWYYGDFVWSPKEVYEMFPTVYLVNTDYPNKLTPYFNAGTYQLRDKSLPLFKRTVWFYYAASNYTNGYYYIKEMTYGEYLDNFYNNPDAVSYTKK